MWNPSRHRVFKFATATALVLLSCGGAVKPPPPEETAADEPLRLYVFDCGVMRFANPRNFSIEDDAPAPGPLRLTPCYMVEHPRGRLLWDGAEITRREEPVRMRLHRRLDGQLGRMGLDLGDLDYLAFSRVAGIDGLFVPESGGGRDETALRLEVGHDHDVFGDGRVRIVDGSVGPGEGRLLFVDLAETGLVVLSADLSGLHGTVEAQRAWLDGLEKAPRHYR